ncbi:hypothetical protein JAAARDRAFT_55557 [Jaapia argillacea MUCL 33604]|uniref:Uncharacterized protein n=1 Tax=Jaapia argillacea MUCL 33604 TaxID=933084 RepID=A0A067Q177_9AGAM|nr:hypothetical protein JAAARDRAFT_55557 [Jaapia argillacea MUCL 33604]
MSSIRIKGPTPPEPDQQHTEPAHIRRKTKRRAILSDDESQDFIDVGGDPAPLYDSAPQTSHSHRPPPAKRVRRSASRETPEYDGGMDVDVEGEGETRFLDDSSQVVREQSVQPLPSRSMKASHGQRKGKEKGERSGRKQKRAAAMIYTDDEDGDGDSYGGGGGGSVEPGKPLPFMDDEEDEDFAPSPRRHGSTTSKDKAVKGKGKAGVGKGGKGKSVKGGGGDREILMKDERKVVVPSSSKGPGTSTPSGDRAIIRRPKPIPKDKERDEVKVDEPTGEVTPTLPPTTTTLPISELTPTTETQPPLVDDPTLPPIQKKRKLPTIKKNKPAPSTTVDSASSTPLHGQFPNKKPVDEKKGEGVPGLPKKPAGGGGGDGPGGRVDFDLRDQSVYNELFKSAGGSTPRSGLNRKEKELERKKELNKMRDEARAKRLEEAKHSFDLQSAPDKISRFEDHLPRKSSALYPNLLAGKLKEIWDRAEKRKERDELERRGGEVGAR